MLRQDSRKTRKQAYELPKLAVGDVLLYASSRAATVRERYSGSIEIPPSAKITRRDQDV